MKHMQKFLAVALIMAVTAFAAGPVSKLYTLTYANGQPTSATAGIPTFQPNTQEPLKSVQVTVADYNDGGADSDFIVSGGLRAWVYHPELLQSDGGFAQAWSRYEALDVDFSQPDAGTGLTIPTYGSRTFKMSPPTPTTGFVIGSRIYFSTFNVADAGVLHQVLIEGRY
jgi:hypothetical protein